MRKFKIKIDKVIMGAFVIGIALFAKANVVASTPAYYISPVFSEHQSKEVTTFFDVKWTPDKSDQVGITITNTTGKVKSFEMKVDKAKTNSNGVVDYSNSTKESAQSEQPTITSMVTFPDNVTVPAHQSKTVYTTLKYPNMNFNGIKMAGVVVKEKQSSESQNVITYALPFIIRGNINQRPTPRISFGKFELKQANFHTFSLSLPISNEKSTLLKNTQAEVEIINANNTTVWSKKSQFLLTPETSFNYNQSINKALNAGNYKIKLIIKHEGKTWESTQSLNISSEKSKKIAKTVPKSTASSYLENPIVLVLVTILGTLSIITLFIWIWSYIRKRKSSKN